MLTTHGWPGCMLLSFEPQVEAVQDTNGKQQRASNQEAPKTLGETSKHMGQPCEETNQSNNLKHKFFQKGGGTRCVWSSGTKLHLGLLPASAFPP